MATTPEAGKGVVTLAAGDQLRIVTAGGNSRLVNVDADLLSLLDLGGPVEEGTWTPELRTSGVNFDSVTYEAANHGAYFRVGNLVHVQFELRTASVTVGSATGVPEVGGLPFAATSAASRAAPSLAVGISVNWANNHPVRAYILPSTNRIALRTQTTAGAADSDLALADVGLGANGNITRASGSYLI